jgi:hypothetical protein
VIKEHARYKRKSSNQTANEKFAALKNAPILMIFRKNKIPLRSNLRELRPDFHFQFGGCSLYFRLIQIGNDIVICPEIIIGRILGSVPIVKICIPSKNVRNVMQDKKNTE